MKKTFLLVAALAATSTLLAQDDLVIYGDVTSGVEWHNFAGPYCDEDFLTRIYVYSHNL